MKSGMNITEQVEVVGSDGPQCRAIDHLENSVHLNKPADETIGAFQ